MPFFDRAGLTIATVTGCAIWRMGQKKGPLLNQRRAFRGSECVARRLYARMVMHTIRHYKSSA